MSSITDVEGHFSTSAN